MVCCLRNKSCSKKLVVFVPLDSFLGEKSRVLYSSSSYSSSASPELDKFPRNAANKDDTDDGSNKKRDDDTSNDTKDADVTTKAENGSESANNSTQEKQMVSQSGNFSKLEKFP